jgi:hypothetical protein
MITLAIPALAGMTNVGVRAALTPPVIIIIIPNIISVGNLDRVTAVMMFINLALVPTGEVAVLVSIIMSLL